MARPRQGDYFPPTQMAPGVEPSEQDQVLSELLTADSFDIPEWNTASVYRRWPVPPDRPSSGPAFLGKLTAPASPEDIQRTWGGGVYDILFQGRGGLRRGSRKVTIDGPPIFQQAQPSYLPAVIGPPQPSGDMALLLGKIEALERRLEQPRETPASRTAELKDLMQLMRELQMTAAPQAQLDPKTLTHWWRDGFQARNEMASLEATAEGGWEGALAQAIPKVLEFIGDRQAQKPARPQVQRRVVTQQKPIPNQPPEAQRAEPQQKVVQGQQAPGIPKWTLDCLREFKMCHDQGEDPAYMAAYLERHVPANLLHRWREVPPSVALAEIMGIVGQFPHLGITQDYVLAVLSELQVAARDEEVASPALAVPAQAPPAGLRMTLAEEDEEEEEDDDEDEDDLDDDEEEDEDDDEPDDDDAGEEDEEPDDRVLDEETERATG